MVSPPAEVGEGGQQCAAALLPRAAAGRVPRPARLEGRERLGEPALLGQHEPGVPGRRAAGRRRQAPSRRRARGGPRPGRRTSPRSSSPGAAPAPAARGVRPASGRRAAGRRPRRRRAAPTPTRGRRRSARRSPGRAPGPGPARRRPSRARRRCGRRARPGPARAPPRRRSRRAAAPSPPPRRRARPRHRPPRPARGRTPGRCPAAGTACHPAARSRSIDRRRPATAPPAAPRRPSVGFEPSADRAERAARTCSRAGRVAPSGNAARAQRPRWSSGASRS